MKRGPGVAFALFETRDSRAMTFSLQTLLKKKKKKTQLTSITADDQFRKPQLSQTRLQ